MSLNNKKPLYRRILDALHEWESVFFSRKPHHMMLLLILLVNVIVVLLAAWVVMVNFAADVIYQYVDPRIRIRA